MERLRKWRHNNPEKNRVQRRRYKYRKKCRDIGLLPPYGEPLTPEQQDIMDSIVAGTFSLDFRRCKPLDNIGKLLRRARQNAKNRGLSFNLTREDIIIPEVCPFFGVKLTFENYKNPDYYSIDRIDSSKGYIKGNVQVISLRANTFKNDLTINELIVISKNILRVYDNLSDNHPPTPIKRIPPSGS